MDTGGLDDRGAICVDIQKQVTMAIKRADLILFMVDSKVGLTALDNQFASWLRKAMGKIIKEEKQKHLQNNNNSTDDSSKSSGSRKREIVCLLNKTEGATMSARVLDSVSDALGLGFGEPLLISAAQGDGMADLASALFAAADSRGIPYEIEKKRNRKNIAPGPTVMVGEEHVTDEGSLQTSSSNKDPIALEDRVIQMAIMGRPNVGKSTLLNSMIEEERVITGPTPGITRDSVHVEWEYNERSLKLVDTAGLTRLRVSKDNLMADRKNKGISEKIGYEKVVLPGIRAFHKEDKIMLPDEDPSQFSYQISEFALQSALHTLRFAQVVLIVVQGEQGSFSQIDLQLARKCLKEGRAIVIAANKSDVMIRAG